MVRFSSALCEARSRCTGFTAWPGPRPMTLQPVFSFSKTAMHSDLRLVPLEQYNDTADIDPLWHDKADNRAVWRGSTTGVWFDRTTRWRASQRVRLYWLGLDDVGRRLVRFVTRGAQADRVREEDARNDDLARRYLDFAFVGDITQCTTDGSCQAARELVKMREGLIWNDQNRYKYMCVVLFVR